MRACDWLCQCRPLLPGKMAEVRRRLWRCSSLQVLGRAGSFSGGTIGVPASALCLPTRIPHCSLWDAAQPGLRWQTCPPVASTGLCEGIPRTSGMIHTGLDVRRYTQGTGFRAAQQNNWNRRSARNGPVPPPPRHQSRTAYYDILEITGNASQSQIKTAFYKQSFRYHPDRNAGSEDAALRFGEVTEAYYVLGSVNLRKKYDQGILSLEDVRKAKKPTSTGDGRTRKGASGQRDATSSAASLRTSAKPMFNFDAFYQAHYGEQLERERILKARRESMEKLKREPSHSWPFEKVLTPG
uniref:DnaJ heat shock protein family (Hsp40) member C30 n=1 Tax=Leptobrachium leishanense TaxID=445787 RepID=A0A8C5P6I1_9ANUR